MSSKIFRQSIDMPRRGGTCVLVGLPLGDFPTPIFGVVLLNAIDDVFKRLKDGEVNGRVVLNVEAA